MMFKIILFVTLLQYLSLHADSLYSGDSCYAEDKLGSCLPLKQCKPIYDEVIRAGSSIPIHIRKKIQSLNCGFEFNDPLVCCISLETNTQGPDGDTQVLGTLIANKTEKPTSTDGNSNNNNSEAYTRRGLEDKNVDIEKHPNIELLPQECGNIEDNRLWGGERTQLFEMPWMALLSYQSSVKLSCVGTIINEWYVLTAAHCVSFLGRLRLTGVILGEYDISQDPDCEISEDTKICAPSVINATIDSITTHPGYTPQTLTDDIALIRLSSPVDFSLDSIKPLCLPITRQLQTQSLVGINMALAGWGVTEEAIESPVLSSVNKHVISLKECQIAYNRTISIGEGQLCAENKYQDSCSGNSGGPLMYPGRFGKIGVRYVQRGIVSFGPKQCGIGGFPGVYTNVAKYMDWILDNIRS